jgi:hypothetical protein
MRLVGAKFGRGDLFQKLCAVFNDKPDRKPRGDFGERADWVFLVSVVGKRSVSILRRKLYCAAASLDALAPSAIAPRMRLRAKASNGAPRSGSKRSIASKSPDMAKCSKSRSSRPYAGLRRHSRRAAFRASGA